MPRAPRGRCTWGGGVCQRKAEFGARCEKHRRGSEGNPLQAFYRSRPWRNLADQVRREEPICQCTGCTRPHVGRCAAPSTDADHVVSMTDGGAPLDRGNVQALCEECHVSKTWTDRGNRAMPVP